MKITVETTNAPAAIGPYSQAIVANGLIYTSGQIPVNPLTGEIKSETIEGQTRQVIENLSSVLEAAGSGLDRVIKTTCFLKNINDFPSIRCMPDSFLKSRREAVLKYRLFPRVHWLKLK